MDSISESEMKHKSFRWNKNTQLGVHTSSITITYGLCIYILTTNRQINISRKFSLCNAIHLNSIDLNMGNKIAIFSEPQIEDYQDSTFFTRKEILRVFKKYRETCPDIVPKQMTGDESITVKVPYEYMEKLSELKENPFKSRICEVFSKDGQRNLTFEDFLDLLSVFSEQAPRELKVFYAFKIYDFDDDQFISLADLEQAARLLTRSELSAEEITQIAEKVIEEADVDGDGKLSYMEFEHVILRAPDFLATFHIRI